MYHTVTFLLVIKGLILSISSKVYIERCLMINTLALGYNILLLTGDKATTFSSSDGRGDSGTKGRLLQKL